MNSLSKIYVSNFNAFNCFKDGEYIFNDPKNFSIILNNFENIQNFNSILICFNAAVGNRHIKTGPFYSGIGISKKIGIPTISLSDYLVTNDDNLTLGWYAGGEGNLDFQTEISKLLDRISHVYNKNLILIGGSGGGFSSLAISSKLQSNAYVISMNPQSSISMYFTDAVKRYVISAFPNIKNIDTLEVESFLSDKNIINNVCSIEYKENIKILYLQNRSDKHHLTRHLSPFIKNKDLFPWGENSYTSSNIGIYLGNWAVGHTPPPTTTVLNLIKLINNGKKIEYLLRYLENGADNSIQNTNNTTTLLTKYDHNLRIKATVINNQINCQITLNKQGINTKIPNDILFAYYILDANNKVVHRTGYSKEFKNLPYLESYSRVKVFAKDSYSKTIIALSNKF